MPEMPAAETLEQDSDVSVKRPQEKPVDNKIVASHLKSEVEACRRYKNKLIPRWKRNVDLRMGNPATGAVGDVDDEDAQNPINPDWSLTKTKTANLYSQVPTVRATNENKMFAASVYPFTKALNYEIGEKRARVAVAMEEALNDVVNASGIASILVGYAARFETVDVPDQDMSLYPPEVGQQMMEAGLIKMVPSERVTDYKFYTSRISPADALWPKTFTGSDYNDAPWVGHDGVTSWAEGQNEFHLKDEDKQRVTSGSSSSKGETLRDETDPIFGDLAAVRYTRLYYWRYRVDPKEKSFSAIWTIVWVEGLTDPVIHEAYKGQQYDDQTRKYVGVCQFPQQFLTLTYISDQSAPPSDTEAGRPQVLDMQRSRSHMFKNRDRSRPMRWYDVNRIDPEIGETIMRGTWQGAIPTNGPGDKVVGEVARASYPSEDLAFDRQAKADLMESWQVGPNQAGTTAGGDTTKGEAEIVQANFSTRIGQERGRVETFFLRIVNVLAGLMALHSDFPNLTDEERQQMLQGWDLKRITHDLALKIRPDSTVLLDSSQRLDRIMKFANMWGKSGFVNLEPLAIESAELSGVDPSEVIKKPEQPKPEAPSISFRFTGKDDIQNPLVLAMLVEQGLAPKPESLDAAKKMLEANLQPAQPPQQPLGGPGGPGGPQVPPDHDEHPDWQLMSKVAQRSEDMGRA